MSKIINREHKMNTENRPIKKTRPEMRFDREAKALQKNLEKRKKQQAERQKLKDQNASQ